MLYKWSRTWRTYTAWLYKIPLHIILLSCFKSKKGLFTKYFALKLRNYMGALELNRGLILMYRERRAFCWSDFRAPSKAVCLEVTKACSKKCIYTPIPLATSNTLSIKMYVTKLKQRKKILCTLYKDSNT